MYEKKVKLVAWLQNPEEKWDAENSASCGARACVREKDSYEIHKQEIARPDYEKRKESIFRETSGRGHGAVLNQSCFLFSIDNLTRASTFLLCSSEYAQHLQQSLRWTTAERGFYLPKSLIGTAAERIMKSQFELYSEMQKAEIPSEDTRFILPLYTKTTIQTLLNARELMHLDSMSNEQNIPSEVKDTIKQMMDEAKKIAPHLMKNRDKNYEKLAWFPSSQLFAPINSTMDDLIYKFGLEKIILIDSSKIPMKQEAIRKAIEERDEAELANLKHYHFTFLMPMSLTAFHQATRQRTWNQSVQSLESAVEYGNFVIPPSIKGTDFEPYYSFLSNLTRKFVMMHADNPDAYGLLPHSLQVYDLIHINAWNAIHSIGKRTCTKAQWEIREIANNMAKEIKEKAPELKDYIFPQGVIYGACPEKEPCGFCDKILKKRK